MTITNSKPTSPQNKVVHIPIATEKNEGAVADAAAATTPLLIPNPQAEELPMSLRSDTQCAKSRNGAVRARQQHGKP